ncbi:Phospholipid hydroperoxide glutathione peroxidase, mitochondrial-like Protein [Tribolium castaneum]|uniref:Glutathione peroxidase n=1 Tax=Tribolium castaneum TaxID=7070 RepID=D6WGA0_TRICA|nr:PREDICTED: probable phospholipid hydroperoxide glutathione peroxidase [Tribolium castaneum]EFA01369.1 Phospholipid hydroperoxide glutathione peroxidase, mitochondrial-like Protein [Tribolium castaneum]|eukprot:XP_969867.1 PREDICTED: probable phospholipid hydroperoxide glutathione peroxidase [Tribolium castaneum]
MPRVKTKARKRTQPTGDAADTKHTTAESSEPEPSSEASSATTIYEFTAKTIEGEEISLEKYKGHVCIIVNVASKCGHTKSNYEQFVELYDKYSEEKGLRILAFPCNQFGGQEPGDSEKICEFVKARNVKFDMFEKIKVNGKDAHPLWKFLKEKLPSPKGKDIKWNFTKFIVNDEGVPVERHASSVKPLTLLESLQKLW